MNRAYVRLSIPNSSHPSFGEGVFPAGRGLDDDSQEVTNPPYEPHVLPRRSSWIALEEKNTDTAALNLVPKENISPGKYARDAHLRTTGSP